MTAVRWGLLSTAAIGRMVIRATRQSELTNFAAVASRDGERAGAFAEAVGIPESFGSYEGMLESDSVDAVYVALPVAMHTEWTIKALQAGKHVLCEKPFAMTAADAARAFDAATTAQRLCVEGLMYRHHPQTALARELLENGAIGTLTYVRAALSVAVPSGDIRRSLQLGGGAIFDLGCYCVSATRLFAGEPERVYAERVLDGGEEGVDLRIAASMRCPNEVLAQFDLGLDLPRRHELELVGTDGRIIVSEPWICLGKTLELWRDGRSEHLPVDAQGRYGLDNGEDDVYRVELDGVSAAISHGSTLPFGRDDAVDQARVLEALVESSGAGVPVEIRR